MGCKQSKDKKEEATAEGTSAEAGDAKVIVVFGSTGAQGGSVLRALVEDSKFKVRAITRDPESDKAKSLKELGAEVVKADLDDTDSLKTAIEGAYGVFCVTNFWQPDMTAEKETQQGKNVVDACKAAGVQHLVYSGLENVKEAIGKSCPHFDAKGLVEAYIKEQEVPYTIVRYSFYFENLLSMMRPKKNEEGSYVLGIPMGDQPMGMVPALECGKCVQAIFSNLDEHKDKIYGLAADNLKIEEYAAIMTKILDDKTVVAGPITVEQFAELGFPGAGDMAAMFEFYQSGSCERSPEDTKKLNPDISTFEQWVEKNKEALAKALDQED